MNRICLYTLILLAFGSFSEAFSQRTEPAGMVQMNNVRVERTGNQLKLAADLSADTRNFDPQMMLTVTPMLVNGSDTLGFEPVTLVGRKRDTAFKRRQAFGNRNNPLPTGEMVEVGKRTATWNHSVEFSAPYRDWMTDARFVLQEDITGCVKWEGLRTRQTIGEPLLQRPVFRLAYVVPVEETKQFRDSHSAFINFEVSRHELLPNYKNNAQVLAEVDQVISELRNDGNLSITEFNVTGYASPEGPYDFNMKLSEDRAHSFVNYLQGRYDDVIPAESMTITWGGEDWDGLREEVEQSGLADKAAVLETLNDPDNARRKSRLKQLSGGRTYAELLAKYYPILRRNTYSVAYVSKPFSLQEAREVIRTKPQHLNLNEMFLVANSYPKESREFKETMEIITRFYPDNEIVALNRSVAEIESGVYESAIQRLLSIDKPEAWNALGVAYYYQGHFEKSDDFFRKAAQSGLLEGVKNAESFQKSISNRF